MRRKCKLAQSTCWLGKADAGLSVAGAPKRLTGMMFVRTAFEGKPGARVIVGAGRTVSDSKRGSAGGCYLWLIWGRILE